MKQKSVYIYNMYILYPPKQEKNRKIDRLKKKQDLSLNAIPLPTY